VPCEQPAPFPPRRQTTLEIAAVVANEAVEVLAHEDELGGASRQNAVFALKSERDAEIESSSSQG